MNVQTSWENAQNSVQYFTTQYASGSFDVLDNGVLNAVGTEVCKNFASASVPEGNLLDSLTDPTSPSQYYGWFTETSYTTATVPALSQYSVFYQIYAGEDQGVYYRIYLKNPKGTTVAYDNPTITVDSGYINKGEQASQKKDFTSSSGYQEMCIVINDQEKCGFKQVSTDFALNYITDTAVANAASQTNISTEKGCTTGSVNAYALLNPNLESGVSSALTSDVYSQGIVRVCSTNSPGSNTGSGRWSIVGYCDDPSLKCWVDEQSIKSSIYTKSLENSTLSAVNEYNQNVILNGSYYSSGDFSEKIESINTALNSGDVSKINEALSLAVSLIDGTSSKRIFYDYQKAYLMILKAHCYSKLAEFVKVESDTRNSSITDCGLSVNETECSKIYGCIWFSDNCISYLDEDYTSSSTTSSTTSNLDCSLFITKTDCSVYSNCLWMGDSCISYVEESVPIGESSSTNSQETIGTLDFFVYSNSKYVSANDVMLLTSFPIFAKEDSSLINAVYSLKFNEGEFNQFDVSFKNKFNSNTYGIILANNNKYNLPSDSSFTVQFKVNYEDFSGNAKEMISKEYTINRV